MVVRTAEPQQGKRQHFAGVGPDARSTDGFLRHKLHSVEDAFFVSYYEECIASGGLQLVEKSGWGVF